MGRVAICSGQNKISPAVLFTSQITNYQLPMALCPLSSGHGRDDIDLIAGLYFCTYVTQVKQTVIQKDGQHRVDCAVLSPDEPDQFRVTIGQGAQADFTVPAGTPIDSRPPMRSAKGSSRRISTICGRSQQKTSPENYLPQMPRACRVTTSACSRLSKRENVGYTSDAATSQLNGRIEII